MQNPRPSAPARRLLGRVAITLVIFPAKTQLVIALSRLGTSGLQAILRYTTTSRLQAISRSTTGCYAQIPGSRATPRCAPRCPTQIPHATPRSRLQVTPRCTPRRTIRRTTARVTGRRRHARYYAARYYHLDHDAVNSIQTRQDNYRSQLPIE